MSEHGVVTEPGTVRFERLLPGPVERVWEYLTDHEKRARWLAGGPIELRTGGKVELRFFHADLSSRKAPTPEKYKDYDKEHIVRGHVTRCDPPRLLSYTWGESSGEDSEVTFELAQQGDRVHLTVTHRRLRGRNEMVSVASGWHTHLAILADRLAGSDPEPFWSVHERVEAEYEARLPEEERSNA